MGANHQVDLTKLKNDCANDIDDKFAVENFDLIDFQNIRIVVHRKI